MTQLPITKRQINFIGVLAKERGIEITAAKAERIEGMTLNEASRFIDWLQAKPKLPKTVANVERGTYEYNSRFYLVTKARGSNRLYAQLLVPLAQGKVAKRYAPGIYSKLTPDMKLSEAKARNFGMAYGVCCMCGRLLSDPESIKNGIGPVCGKRYFGW